MGESKGFTLMEVLIVIVILGVIAGLAIPSYTDQMEKSRAEEARAALYAIYTAEKIYFASRGTFWGAPGTGIVTYAGGGANDFNKYLNLNLAPPKYYPISYITTANGGTTFIAVATRWTGKFAKINETGTYTPPQ